MDDKELIENYKYNLSVFAVAIVHLMQRLDLNYVIVSPEEINLNKELKNYLKCNATLNGDFTFEISEGGEGIESDC